uniref:Uncharacterized protein n=1 Tax=Anguilla anguilla TaxID=7936 RepID=A0A0E9WE72_ANGAN
MEAASLPAGEWLFTVCTFPRFR